MSIAGYFSGGIPFEVSTVNTLPSARSNTAITGGSINLGWSRRREGSSLAVSESLTFMAYPERLLTADHGGYAELESKVWGRNRSIDVAATGQMIDLQQSYFALNSFGLAASLPVDFRWLGQRHPGW